MPAALIVAAGRGVRMGASRAKQFLDLAGRPILAHVLAAFDRAVDIERMVLVLPASDRDECRDAIVAPLGLRTPVELVAGGPQRQDSVFIGLAALAALDDAEVVVIHDGVRPFVDADLLRRCIGTAVRCGSCIPVTAVSETVKTVDESGLVTGSVDRRRLHLAQTPQAFALGMIRTAHREARRRGLSATDDAALVEAIGGRVQAIPGDRFNIKITTPEDLALARAILSAGLWPRRRDGLIEL